MNSAFSRKWKQTVRSVPITRSVLLAAWLLGMAVFFAIYYRQVWQIFTIGPVAWFWNQYSFPFIEELRVQFLAAGMRWSLPAWQESLLRAARAFGGVGTVLLAAQVSGALALKALRWRGEDRAEALLFRTATGLGVVSYSCLGLSALGLYRPLPVQLLLGLLLVAGAGLLVFRRMKGEKRTRVLNSPGRAGIASILPKDQRVWAAVALLAFGMALVGALAPEHEADAMWYHLWLPKLWLQQGGPVDPIQEYISLYPLTWELLYGAAMTVGGAVAAKLLHYASFVLVALLVHRLASRYAAGVSPWLAVALFVTIPTVFWEATTAYIDLGLALFSGLAIYAVLRYLDTRSRSWLAAAAVQLGLALATKHLGLVVLVITTAGLALVLWLEKRSLRQAILPALALGGFALLIPLPWYLRSYAASGNPVFPELWSIFGAVPGVRWDARTEAGMEAFKNHFGYGRSLARLVLLPWDMTVHAASFGGLLGPLFLALLPGIAAGIAGRRTRILLAAAAAAYLAFWASPVSSFQMRFLVPAGALLAVLGAVGFEQLRSLAGEGRTRVFLLQAGMAVMLLLNLPPFTSLHEVDRSGWTGWLTHVTYRLPLGVVIGKESEDNYLRREVASYGAWQHINSHCEAGDRVLTFSGEDHLYSECPRLGSESVMARPATWDAPAGKEEQALKTMRRLGITYVLFDLRKLENTPREMLAITGQDFADRNYHLEYQDARFILFRLQGQAEILE